MNIVKNMEAIFVAAIAVIGASSFATAESTVPAASPAVIAQAAELPMQVVTVSAKRMTAAEKAASAQ